MKISIKRRVKEIQKEIKDAISRKDYSKLLDYIVIFFFLFSILFVVLYKLSTNLESLLFDTNTLVLSNTMKSILPQLMLYTLLGISFIKWILGVKTGNPQIKDKNEEIDSKVIKIPYRNTIYIIEKTGIYTIILSLILALFIVVKVPYWDISFTVNHPLKYNTYVDPALSMLKNNDPFMIQRRYMHNPIKNSLGMGTRYGSLPILEWSLFLGYKIFGSLFSIEAITRMVMLIIGCIALITFYCFLKRIFNEKFALLATFLLSFNSIFNLSSFVTVYDTINFALTFISFSLLIDSHKEKSIQKLFVSSLLLGIGASIKENILLWSIPFVLIYLFFDCKKDIRIFISRVNLYLLGIVLPYAILLTTLNFFPTKKPIYFICFFFSVILLGFLIKYIKRVSAFIEKLSVKFINFVNSHRRVLWLTPLFIIAGIKIVYSTSVSEEFLTDWELLFNTDLYFRFLNEQIIPYLGRIIFYIFLFSVPFFIYYNKKKIYNIILSALLLGSLFYIVTASKALFFHSYYWLFILASIIVFVTWGIFFTGDHLYKGFSKTAYLTLIIFGIFLNVFPSVKGKLNREYIEIYDVIDYINSEDFEEGTSFIDQASLSYLTIKTDLYRVYDPNIFGEQKFKDSVKEIGFIETMKKYKILYLITLNADPDFTIFANSFATEELDTTSYRRTDQILDALYPSLDYYSDLGVRGTIIGENEIYKQFKLVKQFGVYRVYKLTEACFKTVIY